MNNENKIDPYLPKEVRIVKRVQESDSIFTLHLEFTTPEQAAAYHVLPGQFNMLNAYGVGEIPISVVSDIDELGPLAHSIRLFGGVTQALSELQEGDYLGLRGPFGRGWPLDMLKGRDIIIMTGGIGSAPIVTAINEIVKNREAYQRLIILHGISRRKDLIYHNQYNNWRQSKNTDVYFACTEPVKEENWHHGLVIDLLDKINLNDPANAACIMCGPRKMMLATTKRLLAMQLQPEMIFLSLERNMRCGIGHCGHCQCGPYFACKDGPVFSWHEISPYIQNGL
ncbi:MAG: Ni/Fe hydrogenase subunit gamma [Gammaproteobacteria bacterium]|nr:Ni/Fe hydrogenase subunit gamma [Gammaproteobacteria bacterium]